MNQTEESITNQGLSGRRRVMIGAENRHRDVDHNERELSMKNQARPSGISSMGDVRWGTHFCQFYRDKKDLLDILIPYFRAGLKNNEFCLWVCSEPLDCAEARKNLARAVPGFASYVKKRQVEILPYTEWYLKGGRFNSRRVLRGWVNKLNQALGLGFEGMRLSGNTFWLERKDWKQFTDYEEQINGVISRFNMIALCTYAIDRCGVDEVIDVINNHQSTLIRRGGAWTVVENSSYKKTQEELRQTERRFREVYEQSPIGIELYDSAGKLVEANPSCLEIFGVSSVDEVKGFRLFKDPNLSPEVRKRLRNGESVRYEAPFDFEKVKKHGLYRTKKSGIIYLDVLITPLGPRAKSGHEGYMVQVQDITEREQARLARMEAEKVLHQAYADLEDRVKERTAGLARANRELKKEIARRKRLQAEAVESGKIFEGLFSSIITPLALLDREFNFIRVNEAYARASQIPVSEFPGRNHFDLFPNEENQSIFENVVRTRQAYQVQAKPFTFPGHPEWGVTYWDWSLSPILNEKGEVRFLVLSLNDVSEEARAQERLRQNEQLLRNVLDVLPIGIWTIDGQGRIIHGNPAGQEIWGGARYVGLEKFGEYKGWWLDSGKPIAPGEWAGARAIQKGETSINEVIEIETFDGKRKIIRNSAIPIRNARNEVTSAVIVNQDITEEVRLQRQIRQQQKMEALGTLAGGIAHDFNNLLMPIIINAEIELLKTEAGSSTAHSLQLIVEAARRGKELVNQIVTYARQKEQERRPVEIAKLVREALKFLRASVPENIQIRESLVFGPVTCQADPTQIYQVVMNLCHNAAYSMRETGGIMDVSLVPFELPADPSTERLGLKPGSYVRLSVSDTGEGMSQEIIERVFDPFFTTKKPGEGTGLGLSVALGIVKSSGGAITVTSQPGKGSTFHVYLPRIEAGVEFCSTANEAVPRGKERILFIDDEDIQVRTAMSMLEFLGYRVVGMTNPEEALKEFSNHPDDFDLVMTDQNMPRLTGEKLATEILKIRPGIPVILCTGYSELVNEETARALGIREFVMKPLSLQEMASTIRQVLEA